MMMAFSCMVGGTLAYLTAKTVEVKNTFTVGNVDIKLAETTTDFKMVPGVPIAKDPKVTVEGGSEDCWLFVKVDESTNLTSFIDYTVDSAWTALDGETGVYYCEVAANSADQVFKVLKDGITADDKDGSVTVKDTVTKEMMDKIADGTATAPTLTFTAYAVQKAGFDSAVAAWAEARK